MMYLFSILAVMLTAIFMAGVSDMGFGVLAYCFDITSVLLLLLLCIPMLLSSHLTKDFNNAFRIGWGKGKGKSLTEIKRSIEAVDLVMKVLLYGAVFITVFSVIIILGSMEDIATLGPNLSVAVLSLLYALAINLFLLPLKSKLKMKMMEYMQE